MADNSNPGTEGQGPGEPGGGKQYWKLVQWYRNRFSEGARAAFSVALILLCCAYVYGTRSINQTIPSHLANETFSPVDGYDRYASTIWLVGIVLGILVAFAYRFGRGKDSTMPATLAERVRSSIVPNFIAVEYEKGVLQPFWQILFGVLFVVIVLVEIFGIVTNRFTISGISRDYSFTHIWLYSVCGIITGLLILPQLDMTIPGITRFIMIAYVAISAHIFWWIAPAPDSVTFRGTPAAVVQHLQDKNTEDHLGSKPGITVYGPKNP